MARAELHLSLEGNARGASELYIYIFISLLRLCEVLLAARGSSGWIFGRDNVQQSFPLCVLPLSIFRAKVSGSGGLKEKQQIFKHCFARGLFRSCLLKKEIVLFLIYYSNATSFYCWLFLKLPSGCLFFLVTLFSLLACINPFICPSARQE